MRPPHLLEECAPLIDAAAAAPSLLIALDFDGTLSPIVPTPDEATIHLGAARAIEALCLMNDPGMTLAVVTGRSVADVSPRIPMVDWVIGLHGLQMRGPNAEVIQRLDTTASDATLERLRSAVGSIVEATQARLEDKGRSMALHVRGLPAEVGTRALEQFEALVERERAAGAPVECLRGKAVAEVRPAGVSKATALRELCATLGDPAMVYAGDDTTDEDVFRDRPDALSIVIVEQEKETAAKTSLRSPQELARFLRELGLRRIRAQSG